MRKFSVLLKKEIKELFTIQIFIPIVLMALMFMLLGSIIGNVASDNANAAATGSILILDNDNSALSQKVREDLVAKKYNIKPIVRDNGNKTLTIDDAKGIDTDAIFIIPEGFENSIMSGKPQYISTYSALKSLSVTSNTSDALIQSAISIINNNISNLLITQETGNSAMPPEFLKNPVMQNNFVMLNNKTANISTMELKTFLMTQNIFIPIVMFMIIIYSTQLLITTVASERENKTMETLLSTPVTRSAIVGAKMLAAGISALVFAVVYMLGFQYYMSALTGGNKMSDQLKTAVEQLGLTMGFGDFLLLGLSLFASILVALALASILGSMADDARKAQSFITPVMLLVLIPYLLTMLIDINTAQPILKFIVNIIPFSHPFQASSYLFMKNYGPVLLGILYQLAIFGIMLLITTKIYSSDRIFITKHSSGRKKLGLIKKGLLGR